MVTERIFETLPTGEPVKIFHLENQSGAYAEVLQYGAILVKLCVPDRSGRIPEEWLFFWSMYRKKRQPDCRRWLSAGWERSDPGKK